MLRMEDDGGIDAKILAVPLDKLTPLYRNVHSYRDMPEETLDRLAHFFAHYKDLEKGKWVKINGWVDVEEAKQEILDSIERYCSTPDRPAF